MKLTLNGMALASLIPNFFSFIVPLGVAALTLGHIPGAQNRRQRRPPFEEQALHLRHILAYLQVPVGGLIFLGAVGLIYEFDQELGKHTYERAAVVEPIKIGDLHKVTPPDSAKEQKGAVAVLRMIRARLYRARNQQTFARGATRTICFFSQFAVVFGQTMTSMATATVRAC